MRFFGRRRQQARSTDAAPSSPAASSEAETTDEITTIKLAALDTTHSGRQPLRTTLLGIHPNRLAGTSHRMRSHYTQWVPGFDELDVRQAKKLIDAHADRTAVGVALSMHRDGHIRELAVEALEGAADPLVVPFLLLRCGEWTGAVRQVATSAIDQWIHVDHVPVLVQCVPLLAGARFAPSRPARDVPHRIDEVLRSPAARPALLEAVADQDTITARNAVRLAVADGPTIDLLKRAVATGDVVSTALACRPLPTVGPINEQTGELLWQHPAASLRQEGVYRLLKHDGPQAETVARTAMCDRSASVRSTAQRWFRNRGNDPAAFYRSIAAAQPLASLLGLGDHPDAQEAAFARASLEEPPVIRRAALRLLGKLGRREDQDVFLQAFMTGSGRERGAAMAWFRRTGMTPEILEALWSAEDPDAGNDTKARVLAQLAPMTSVWCQIDFALRAINTREPELENAGVTLLSSVAYQASGFRTRAKSDQLARLRAAFESARPAINPNLASRIEHLLQP